MNEILKPKHLGNKHRLAASALRETGMRAPRAEEIF